MSGEADVIPRLLHAIDARDWDGVRAGLADEVVLDYSSMGAGPAETLSGDAVVARWHGLLPGFDATNHLCGPVVLDGDRAVTSVRAHHWIGEEVWSVWGHYVATVAGGRISSLTLQTAHQGGNLELPALATKRAAG